MNAKAKITGTIVKRLGCSHVRVAVAGAKEEVTALLPPLPALGDEVTLGSRRGELVVAEYVHGLEAVRLAGAKEDSR